MASFHSVVSLSVFLIEPSPVQARVICAALKNFDISNVRVFDRGNDALVEMCENRPDLVISALYLPDMTGTELVISMRSDPDLESVAFILISSETRPQALDPVRQSGVCGILPKPFSQAQLSTALSTTLDYLHTDESLANESVDLESLKVLLVDDSSSARKFSRRVLENLGITNFVEAENGVDAIAKLAETMFDLVVTDYNMPEMDGRALVEYIRTQSWQNSVPILMVTSERDEGRLAGVEDAGVSGICDKPFEPSVIKRLLEKILSDPERY